MGAPGFLRNFAYGLAHFGIDLTCVIPSQHLRRFILKRVFGLSMGRHAVIYRGCHLRSPWKIRIGAGSAIGGEVELDGRGRIEIGENVNLSTQVMLWTAQHDHRDPKFTGTLAPIVLKNFVWLGPRVIVLPGITVEEGCVVAAGAVVTKDTEPYGIYAGVPAQRIGERARNLDYTPGKEFLPFA